MSIGVCRTIARLTQMLGACYRTSFQMCGSGPGTRRSRSATDRTPGVYTVSGHDPRVVPGPDAGFQPCKHGQRRDAEEAIMHHMVMHDISASKQPACREAEAVHLEHGCRPAVHPNGTWCRRKSTARIVENAMRRRVIRFWIEHESDQCTPRCSNRCRIEKPLKRPPIKSARLTCATSRTIQFPHFPDSAEPTRRSVGRTVSRGKRDLRHWYADHDARLQGRMHLEQHRIMYPVMHGMLLYRAGRHGDGHRVIAGSQQRQIEY